VKKLPSIDKAKPGGHNDFLHRYVGYQNTTVEIYDPAPGTSPEEMGAHEERVHGRAADWAEASVHSLESTDPKIEGDTVSLHSYDSEDRNQDAVHKIAAKTAFRRTR
jgi:hypothetical protein